jgi:hypothetical protein
MRQENTELLDVNRASFIDWYQNVVRKIILRKNLELSLEWLVRSRNMQSQ